MKQMIITRFMHWKKQSFALLFWLFLPIFATWAITTVTNSVTDDAKVPVGIVLEEQSDTALELVEEIRSVPFVRSTILEEKEALYKLKKHELDSVFVIEEGYQDHVRHDQRNQLITGYYSDLSFAFVPVKEMILSYVQQETSRAKAAISVKNLENKYNGNSEWSAEEIIAKSKEIQQNENLLETTLSFSGSKIRTEDDPPLFLIWGIWGIFTILSAFLIFDWVIKEKHANVAVRFPFTRTPLKTYLIQNFILYTLLFLITDFLAVSFFYMVYHESINILNLIIFRILINLAAFLLAQLFSNIFLFYCTSFGLTLTAGIISGALLPSGFSLYWSGFDWINPLRPLLDGKFISLLPLTIVILAVLWGVRKENTNA
ncbi:ABC transporter permease [Virgibacillus siamensis]|uniref:ABC transporter permease n=1 Tax=Virgibacillus siamensis TaxID=480071 RepID=UPI00158AA60C|nr:ABC transporter permease [Virgibacillus siamensis]